MRIHELDENFASQLIKGATNIAKTAAPTLGKTAPAITKSFKPMKDLTDKFRFFVGNNTVHIAQVAKDPAGGAVLKDAMNHLRNSPAINGKSLSKFVFDNEMSDVLKKPQVIQATLGYMYNTIKYIEPVLKQNLNPTHPRTPQILKTLEELKQLYVQNVAYWK